ncbi:hypothetical protein WN944_007171 [Citrus x changshan-huyou]|uniref:Uncharacterized protein n=1 Tax=Citrus x changshan-huyou TaxID=2935761 RepID=A0AAP0MN11_9ROSI
MAIWEMRIEKHFQYLKETHGCTDNKPTEIIKESLFVFKSCKHIGSFPAVNNNNTKPNNKCFLGFNGKDLPSQTVGSPAVWVFEELDDMAKMGEDVGKDDIEFNMDLLLNKACYLDALEIPMWNKRYFELTTGDIAVRLVLIFHYKE